jgi:transcriptional regulator with XRE-family HTH domain
MPDISTANFVLATPAEIAREFGGRLRSVRLSQGLQQEDLARMAGVSRASVTALENRGNSTLQTFLRVTIALGLVQELQELFTARPFSIAQLQAASRPTKRSPRKPRAGKV